MIYPHGSSVWANLDMAIDERVWWAGGVVIDKIKLWAPTIARIFPKKFIPSSKFSLKESSYEGV